MGDERRDTQATPVTGTAPSAFGSTLEWGVADVSLDAAGSGDGYVVAPHPRGMLVAVVDALGHGAEAAQPAALAVAEIGKRAHEPVLAVLQRCHEVLVGSRGVVLSVASFDFTERTMTWVGVGDVAGVMVFGDLAAHPPYTALVHRGGVAGLRLPPLRPWVIPVGEGDTLIFATDGVRPGFESAFVQDMDPQRAARAIMDRFRKGTDDALVLVARFTSSPRHQPT